MPQLDVRLLGAVEVRRDGTARALAGRRVRALLAVLALSAGRTLPTDTLAARVWDEGAMPERVRASVHTIVARLRGALGPEVVRTEPGGYRLDLAREDVDVLALTDQWDGAGESRSAEDERRLLEASLRQWQEPFGEELSDWLSRYEAPRLREMHLRALERRVDLDLAAGGHGRCALELRALTAAHPLRETLWLRLVRAPHGDGRTAEALTAYEQLRVHLADELGVDPSPALQALHRELLVDEPLPADAPAHVVLVPRQLPSDVPRFTGRDQELDQLDALAGTGTDEHDGTPPSDRLVVVQGPGGSGKTSLVVHWARRSTAHFPDGQLFLNLRGFGPGPVTDPGTALGLMLRAVGVDGSRIPDDLDQCSALARTELSGRRMLIVLDNARDAEQLRPLLPGGACTVVVTSRRQLRSLAVLDGAGRVALGPMPPQDAVALLHRRLGGAGQAEGDAGIALLAELCGHLPIALAVAAERAGRDGAGGVGALVRQLLEDRHRLAELSSGDDPLTDVRRVFASTYETLDRDSASVFRLLALHPDASVSAGAAAALSGAERHTADTALDRLTDCHLLRLTAPGWFEIHDLVRDYAVELLEQEEGPATRAASRRRLLSWYAHSAEAACLALGRYSTLIEVGPLEPGVRPDVFADPAQALAWFARHRRALTELVHRAAGEEDHATVHRLVPRLGYYLSRLSAAIEELALQRMALASARALGTDEAIGGAANNLGIAYGRLGRYPEAMESFDTAERHCAAAELRLGVLRVRDNVATVLTLTGRPEEAIGMLEQNLADLGGPPDSAESIATLNNLANGYLAVGRYADAVATAQRCRAAAREARRPAEEALALDGLGSVYLRLGEPERACSAFRKALALSRQGGDRPGEARVRMELGEAHLAAGRPDQARRDWTACLQLLDDMGAADLPRVRREEVRGRLADLERQVEPTG